jgi:hypothetical protein
MTTPLYASGGQTRVATVVETTYGTTPATPTMLVTNFVTFGLNKGFQTFQDASVRNDRMTDFTAIGNSVIKGDIDVNLRNGEFDHWFEMLMATTLSSQVATTGTTTGQSLSIEAAYLDQARYRLFTGCLIDKCAFSFAVNKFVGLKFSVMAQNMTASGSATGTTYTAASTAVPMKTETGTMKIGGTASALVESLDFTYDNKLQAAYTLANTNAQAFGYSLTEVKGTATVLIDSTDSINATFLAGTSTSIEMDVTDGTNTYKFALPNVTITDYQVSLTGTGFVKAKITFNADKDQTTGTNLKITV